MGKPKRNEAKHTLEDLGHLVLNTPRGNESLLKRVLVSGR